MMFIRYFFFFCFFIQATAVSAEDLASIRLNPENPAPYSSVEVKLESFYFDVNVARITWEVNGRVILTGVGEKKISIITGAIGQPTTVKVTAEASDGSKVEQVIPIRPSSITLLYEAPKSYIPLLYKGRSLPADGTEVKVTAFPQISEKGAPVSPSNVSYSWYVNDEFYEDISGYGKQSASIKMDYLSPYTEVRVLARTTSGTVAEKSIDIYHHAVTPLVYLYDPVLGTRFSKLLERRFETTEDFTLMLEPLYVTHKESKAPTYTWTLNGSPSTPLDGRSLSFQPKKNSYGSQRLQISVIGPNAYLEEGEVALDLVFDTRR